MSVPVGRALVLQRAVRDAVRTTAEQPLIVMPLELNATVPVGTGDPAGATVAVKVTDWADVEGFLLIGNRYCAAMLSRRYTRPR